MTIAVLLFDVVYIGRRPREPSVRECAIYLSIYVGLALAFGGWVWLHHGSQFGLEFFAGWLTEYSLSVDNLFLFMIIMTSFNVPKIYQQQALLIGIVLALVFRGVFIAVGAVAISEFSWVFYIFGLFLIYTGFRLARQKPRRNDRDEDRDNRDDYRAKDPDKGRPDGPDEAQNWVVSFAASYLNTTDRWAGLKLYVKDGRQRLITPMFLVILALATTDIVFALDSIPAIYGLTSQAYLVFAANVFALMGLRQLYFLLGGLFKRLVYLSQGLAVILCFIGVKLVLHALHENKLPFINGGERLDVPQIPTLVSLGVIALTLIITAVASLATTAKRRRTGDAHPSAS